MKSFIVVVNEPMSSLFGSIIGTKERNGGNRFDTSSGCQT